MCYVEMKNNTIKPAMNWKPGGGGRGTDLEYSLEKVVGLVIVCLRKFGKNRSARLEGISPGSRYLDENSENAKKFIEYSGNQKKMCI